MYRDARPTEHKKNVSTVISIDVLTTMGLPQSADTTREDTPLTVIYSPVTKTKCDQQDEQSYTKQKFQLLFHEFSKLPSLRIRKWLKEL
jgi:hypothetical protein